MNESNPPLEFQYQQGQQRARSGLIIRVSGRVRVRVRPVGIAEGKEEA